MTKLKTTIQSLLNVKEELYYEDAQLLMVLKRRLTKREMKLFNLIVEGKSVEEALQTQEMEQEAYDTIVKKLNSEKIKQELANRKGANSDQ
jgi:hypothetical protein